jgi:hypothetical protein
MTKIDLTLPLHRPSILLKRSAVPEAGDRDAVHVATVCVTSTVDLLPGQTVIFSDRDCKTVVPCHEFTMWHAKVNPFLGSKESVPPGEKVWVLVHPRFVSNLTHTFDVSHEIPEPIKPEPEPYYDEEDWCHQSC